MRTWLVFWISGAALFHCQAGSIVGTVRAQGKEGASEDLAAGKYDSRKFKFIERINYAEMRDFIVYIDDANGKIDDNGRTLSRKVLRWNGKVYR